MEVLWYGYRIPFLCDPPLSKVPISLPSYHPLSTKGVALGEVTQALIAKSAVELAPLPSLGFYSRLFVVWKTSGSWRPVIDLSTFNLFVDVSHFRMETIQSVLLSVRQGDWMASIDLKEAYLQVPAHPDSRRFLRFVAQGNVYQFSALCFGLSTAPQVFSRVMAPVSAILHSDVGWGAHLGSLTASGLWDLNQASLSINARELLAIMEGLLHFQSSLVGRNVSVFCDNSTAVSYLCKEGCTRSPFLNSLTQGILRWAESLSIRQLPQFVPGSLNVLADSLSRPHQLPHTEWSLHPEVFLYQSHVAGPDRLICNISKSPMFSLFLSLPGSDGCGHRRLPPTLGRASGLRVSSVVCHSTGAGETPCVSSDGAHPDSSILASASVVSRPPSPVAGPSGCSTSSSRPPAPASVLLPLPGSPQASTSCLETLRRFTRAAGFSSSVASQASLSRRPSSRKAYQLKWQVYRSWCHSHGHSVSRFSLAKVADYLCWLRSSKNLGVSSLKSYRSMLSAVFRFQLPSLTTHPVLRDLLRSFCLESAERQLRPPAWDLSLVLRYLNTSAFEPLSVTSLRALTQKVLFLLALATAKRVGELQALSSVVTFVHGNARLSYVP